MKNKNRLILSGMIILIIGMISPQVKAKEYNILEEFNGPTDKRFVNFLKENYPNETMDNYLTEEELKNITSMTIDVPNLASLPNLCKNFEYLKELKITSMLPNYIYIDDCKNLETLDLKSNSKIEYVNIYKAPKLKNLTLPTNIKHLSISYDLGVDLNNYDFSMYLNLEEFEMMSNDESTLKYEQLDISRIKNLKKLSLYGIGLKNIDVSQNKELLEIMLGDNKLTNIDVSKNLKLEKLDLADNNIKNIDISKNINLKEVDLSNNSLSSLDVSKNSVLEKLRASGNNIKEINIWNNEKLKNLDVTQNNITTIDLTNNKKIEYAALFLNQLNTIKLPNVNQTIEINFYDQNIIKTHGEYDYQKYNWYMDGTKYQDPSLDGWVTMKLLGQTLYLKEKNESVIFYQTEVQKKGWLSKVIDGKTSGTVGSGLRMEALKVKLENQEYTGNIEYRTHIQKKGWESTWKKNGEISGTVGEGLRLEAVQIRLTGEMAKYYDIYYRIHSQRFGWLDWTKNGASAGTAGFGFRVEAVQIKLVKKGSAAPGSTKRPFVSYDATGVTYQTQVQKKGWLTSVSNGETSGTVGQGLRMESLKINLKNQGFSGNIEYRTHIQKRGWESTWKKNGETSGTVGLGLRLEALQLRLTGNMAKEYDIYYRVQAQKFGWLGWAKNGESAGTAGYGYRLEAIQIVLVRKGMTPPGSTANHFYSV